MALEPGHRLGPYEVLGSLDAALAAGREAGLKGATMEDAVRRLAAPKTP